MQDTFLDLLIAGRIPGTQTQVNFEAFIQGVLAGLAVLLTIRLITSIKARRQPSADESSLKQVGASILRVYRPSV